MHARTHARRYVYSFKHGWRHGEIDCPKVIFDIATIHLVTSHLHHAIHNGIAPQAQSTPPINCGCVEYIACGGYVEQITTMCMPILHADGHRAHLLSQNHAHLISMVVPVTCQEQHVFVGHVEKEKLEAAYS